MRAATEVWDRQIAVSAPLTTFDAQRVLATVDAEERLWLLDGLLRELEETLGLELRAGD